LFYSLRSRLMLVFSILCVVPLAAAIAILSRESADLIRRSIETSTTQTIDQFAFHVTTLLTQVEDIGTQVMSSQMTQDWAALQLNPHPPEEELVFAKQRIREFFSSFAINNSNGITISAYSDRSGGLYTQDRQYAETAWYREFAEGRQRWTSTHLDIDQTDRLFSERSVNSLILPLVHLQTLRQVGFVKINYPTKVLKDAIEKIGFGRTGEVYLVTSEGESVLGQSFGDNQAVVADALQAIGSGVEPVPDGALPLERGGKTYLIFSRTLPAQGWVIVGVVPEGELYQEIEDVRRLMIAVGVLMLAIVVLVAVWLSFGITKPLSAMANAMKHVERGEFGQALRLMPAVRSGHSEIGYVTRTFQGMTERLRYLIETEFETNLRRKNAEYKALLLQINPHFYNNTLEIISGLAAMKREDLVMDATESLGKMMRYSLDLSSDLVQVKEELDYMRDYLFILKLRYADSLRFSIKEDESAGAVLIPKFILQPLAENAVKYSLEKQGTAIVSVEARTEDGALFLTVKDNGIGISAPLAESLLTEANAEEAERVLGGGGRSIGLRNVLARCRLMYGERFTLHLRTERDAGTEITLQFPAARR